MRNRALRNMILAMPLASPCLLMHAQQSTSSAATTIDGRTPVAATVPTAVPALVPFSAAAVDSKGKQLAGEASVTFMIYKDQQGGEPVFTESQMVTFDETGHYKVQLGATNPQGLPTDLFSSGEARWLEVQISGQPTGSRMLLASVPYALKAADAATLGGLPASAFVLAGNNVITGVGSAAISPDAASTVTTTGGTSGQLPLFNGVSSVVNSAIYQSGTNIGIGRVPQAALDVNGAVLLRGDNTITPASAITASMGSNSHALRFDAGAYNSSTKAAVDPYFQLQTEPTGNNTTAPGATFNFLYNTGTASSPSETGLYINPNGTIHFVSAQTFPGAGGGSGTITGVTAGTGLTGGGTSGTVTLNVNTAVIPILTGNNNFTGTDTFTASINENTDINIDNTNKNSGAISPGVRLGSASGEGMASKRTSGGNQYGVDLFTDYKSRLAINEAGQVAIGTGDTFNTAQLYVVGATGDGADFTGYGYGYGVRAVGGSTSGYGPGFGGYFTGGASTGSGDNESDGATGLYGTGGSANGTSGGSGVEGDGGYSTSGQSFAGGVFVGGDSTSGYGGDGLVADPGSSNSNGYTDAYAARLNGEVDINGTVHSDVATATIDHPFDPANKSLTLSSIQSSEMVNMFSGNVTTDGQGLATVQLPSWFEAVNGDLRYQLTTVGRKAQAWISAEVKDGSFQIASDTANVKISWQITGVRQDAYAKAHPLVVEQEKQPRERGFYRHPELYGQPSTKQSEWARRPSAMRRIQQLRIAQQNGNRQTTPSAKISPANQ